MHRYFLIPILGFFGIICLFVFYLQFINEDWKFIVPKKKLPEVCNNNTNIEFVIHDEDYIQGRNFKDSKDTITGNQIHAIYLLPCEREDRKFDVKLNIEYSLLSINNWFFNKSLNQKLRFDINDQKNIDVTFLRVNKTMDWFDDKVTDKNSKKIDVSEKIKKIIHTNKDKFNNYHNKKFIIFFEGWERRKYINFNICGKADFDGNISIYYTYSRFKKYIGNEIILNNKKQMFTCTKNDHLNDINDLLFGDAEATILHELLHTLGMPPKCSKNLDNSKSHITDSTQDIMHKESGIRYLDYNNDDYYNHSNNCPDLKNSEYLITY